MPPVDPRRCRSRGEVPGVPVGRIALVLLWSIAGSGCAGGQRVARPGTAAAPPGPVPGIGGPLLPSSAAPAATAYPGAATVAGDRTREESQLMQEEIAALRAQLASTSAQLAGARAASAPPTPSPGSIPPATMQSALSSLALSGVEARYDGAVVRLELPADTLFDGSTANLVPAGVALLTQVADEVQRVYPGHYLGIESHVDTEPLQNASWGSPHQLTAARAAAVFDFMTTRTKLRERQLFIVAHGANHPVVSNATAAGRAKNRRIELVIYPERAGGD